MEKIIEPVDSEPLVNSSEVFEMPEVGFVEDGETTGFEDPELMAEISQIPDKMAFKIGEVAEISGVKTYVLRYWESEFEALRPKKSTQNQRMFTRADVEKVLLIKKLLYKDRFSIEGARKALKR